MSGGGHVIIDDAVSRALDHPLVLGALPADTKTAVQAILAKASTDWTLSDRCTLGHAVTWALVHL